LDDLLNLERLFTAFGYDSHVLSISNIYFGSAVDTDDQLARVISVYREAVLHILELNGIALNIEDKSLTDISKVLEAINILNAETFEELGNVDDLDSTTYIEVLLAQALDVPEHQFIGYIARVKPKVVQYILDYNTMPEQEPTNNGYYRARWKRYYDGNNYVVSNMVRGMDDFGWTTDSILTILMDALSDLTDINQIAKEIRLVVMGSNTPDVDLLVTAISVSEYVLDNSLLLFKVTSVLRRLDWSTTDE